MNNPLTIDLFVEDSAHEAFIRACVNRLAAETGTPITLQIRNARGGRAKVINEFKQYQLVLLSRVSATRCCPDLVVVGLDANCRKRPAMIKELLNVLDPRLRPLIVFACPSTHIELWYLADSKAFAAAVGHAPTIGRKKCKRDYYKGVLAQAVVHSGHPAMLGGIDFAQDIVAKMNFYVAGKTDKGLKLFWDETRRRFNSIKQSRKKI